MDKHLNLSFIRRRSRIRTERPVFVVPDLTTQVTAADAIARVKLPEVPELKALGHAKSAADRLLARLNKSSIKIVRKPGVSRDEAYAQNSKTLELLVEQRDALTTVIEDMVQPVIAAATGHSRKIQMLIKEHEFQEERIRHIEELMKTAFGDVPEQRTSNGKKIWSGQLQEAARLVRGIYNEDLANPERKFKDLRDASDSFFARHVFVHKPDLTRDQFYDNVKKAA
jgi:hypothetical protein